MGGRTQYLIILILCLTSNNIHAGSIGGFGGALEVTQIANNTQLINSAIEQVQQTQHLFNSYQILMKNVESLSSGQFQNVHNSVMQLFGIIKQANSISYQMGAADTYFQGLHPDYATLYQGNNFASKQQSWRDAVYNMCNTALNNADLSISSLQNDSQVLQALGTASKTAVGQKSAIQAGNEISAQIAAQLSQLKILTATQIQAQTTYMTTEKLDQEAKEKAKQEFHKTGVIQVDLSNNNPWTW